MQISKLIPYLCIIGFISIVFLFLGIFDAQRVGDGSEYYALFYSWLKTCRPWMTPISFDAYQELYDSKQIIGMVSREGMENAFPVLKLGITADFNHFWFYSFLAFLVSKLLLVLGISVAAHASFLLLHFCLLVFTACVSFYFYRWHGIVAFSIMTIGSPMLWFFDKVHTELFTYCLTLSAVIFVCAKKYLPGAFLLALSSTQNPSFALIALIPLLYRFICQRSSRYDIIEICLIVSTVVAILLHPVYYFLRFNVVTPQLLAGGASLGGSLSSFYIWILDPDIGLLPNWPLGVIVVFTAIILYCFCAKQKNKHQTDKLFIFFFISFLVINLYAHSSTTNINSGGTPGLARYALWYLPLFFPITLYVLRNFPAKKLITYSLIFFAVIVFLISVVKNDPRKHEEYNRPTSLSNFIQTKISFLYNPPIDVFSGRFSNEPMSAGILGPDCKKLLIYPYDENRKNVTTPLFCTVDQEKMQLFVRSIAIKTKSAFYTHINHEKLKSLQLEVLHKNVLNMSSLNFHEFGIAHFNKKINRVDSDVFTDAALVSNGIILPAGIYKLSAVFDWDVTSKNTKTNGGHLSLQGKKLLMPIMSSKAINSNMSMLFQTDGKPFSISFGLGGWSVGKGFVELKQLKIESVAISRTSQ